MSQQKCQKITQMYLRELLKYDNGKLYWAKKHSRKTVVGEEAGTLRKTDGYRQIMINFKPYRTHRLIYLYHKGYTPPIVDHINGDVSDNRIENLRSATINENAYNSKVRPDNTSGVKGVTWDKNKSRWMARVIVNGKCINLGRYKELELAGLVATEARDKYHKEFAKHG